MSARKWGAAAAVMAVVLAATAAWWWQHKPAPAVAAVPAGDALLAPLHEVLADYRRIIVLLADEKSLSGSERARAITVGQVIFHEKLAHEAAASSALAKVVAENNADRFARLEGVLDYIESDRSLYDADRLAFREVLLALQTEVARDGSLPAIKLHKRIGDDLDALAEIERQYDREISQIFSHFEQRAIVLKREKWQDYVAHLEKLYQREAVLKDYGYIQPYDVAQLPKDDAQQEVFGQQLPAKTVALTFDDGPHAKFTDEIVAILKQYGVPATFFEVGRNIGSVDAAGKVKLGGNARVSQRLIDEGYAVGNHSYTHAQLSKESGEALQAEILNTDVLLKSVDARRSPLFRFPYGARNAEGLQMLETAKLRSIMWNVDSLDWADPVPSSIADRVLREVNRQDHGIILFHDIHERTVKALPLILDRLVADGYRFAGWDGNEYSVQGGTAEAAKQTVTTGYAGSWAIVIGINDYAKWPKLQYAVNDAQAMQKTLVDDFGFAPDHVILLKDGEATRNRILAAFHDQLAHDGLQKNDRVFVFFAGHGATRKLSSGRDIGYIIPADADPAQTATDAIPMTEIQNIAESIAAKHVFFVMDACYSGLGLTRGASGNFLRENAKRTGRQMLTAGGADQMVADGGPDGHSVFTWTLLQGLKGKGDLNGDGLITATELAAYVAPAVSGVSQQTPAFGSLPGSEGGDFVFELAPETEFISSGTEQLSGDAIALNGKLDAAAPTVTTTAPGKTAVEAVKVPDLQGKLQTLKTVPIINQSARQLAQRANDRGLQLFKEKNYAEAEQQFTEALKLRPDFALAANNLGFVYYRQQKYAEAARWFENTIKSDPSRAVAYLNLGDAYARGGDAKRAAQAYRTYLELLPNGPAASYVKQQLQQG
ncbi:MAG: polysaccharide deacetylase family protein [Pedobacter sp.]|nr:polysaccharide deacetylase family protein [Pedobacter sp.]